MQSKDHLERNRALGLALGLIVAFSAAAAIGVLAPAAVAQKTTPEFGKPFQDARAAAQSKDWSTALSKADAASTFAKTQGEKQGVETVRVMAYQGLGKKPEMLKALENQLAIGGLPAETVKINRRTIAGMYARDMHNEAKAVELTKAIINDYGGGLAEENAYVASYSQRQKNYKDAIASANKAIEISRKEGKKPKEAWYQIVQKAYFEQKDEANYYATVDRTAQDYPTAGNLEILINRTTKEQHFNRTANMLDLNRALQAAKVTIKPQDLAQMGEDALSRGNPAESAKIFESVAKSNWAGFDATSSARYKKIYDRAETDAKSDAATGLAGREKDAAAAPKGDRLVAVGDCYLGAGDNVKAIEQINKGLAKGNLDAGQLAFAKLDLGIAQFRSSKKDDARKTWGEITGDNGAAVLAKSWMLISR